MRERRGVRHLGGVELQIKGETKPSQQRKSAPPRVRPDQIRPVDVDLGRVGMPINRMTDSANIRMADVTFEDLLDVGCIQSCPAQRSRAGSHV